MITVTKQITLNPGVGETGPYTYTWGATTPAAGCLSFSPNTTGIIVDPSSQSIITDLNFFNQTCLEDSTVTLTISYNGGTCTKVFPITIANPCDDFEIGSITTQTNNGYLFSISPTGGTGPFSYNWDFDESLFTAQTGTTSNVFRLLYTGEGNPPSSSTVWVTVVDANGCSASTTADFSICALSFDNVNRTAVCNPDGTSSTTICVDPEGCASSLVDWGTLWWGFPVTGLSASLITGGPNLACTAAGGKKYRIDVASTVPAGDYVLEYGAATTNGIYSNVANIFLTVPGCSINQTSTVVIEPIAPITISCDYVDPIYYIGPLTSYTQVVGDATIDWTTFHFIDMTDGSDLGAGPLTTTLSGTVEFNINTLNIEYTIPAATGTDSFRWTVCDTNGNCAQSQVYAIILDCVLAPVADDDSECAACGEAIEHDVLDNDTINGVLFYLDVTTAPTNGSAVFNGSYSSPRIIYTPNATYSGTDTYVYTLTNDSGLTDTAEVTVNVVCAGVDANISVCE